MSVISSIASVFLRSALAVPDFDVAFQIKVDFIDI